LGHNSEETERLRRLAREIQEADDADALGRTLVAYGQWLSRQRPSDLYQLRIDFENASPSEQANSVMRLVGRETEQATRKLTDENRAALRNAIFALAKQMRDDFVASAPSGGDNPIAKADPKDARVAMFLLTRAAQSGEDVLQRLEETLTPEAREHLNKISRWPERRRWQLWAWIHEATKTKPTPEQLERFFASDAVKPDVRQALLDMPKDKMDVALERLYWKTELGIDEPPSFREFGERRGPRSSERGFGPQDAERRGPGRPRGQEGPPPEFRPDGPPPRIGPEGRPPDRNNRPPRPGDEGQRRDRPPRDREPFDGPRPLPPPEREGPPNY
jgi:hypothetical protein